MKFSDLYKSVSLHLPAIYIDRVISKKDRHIIRKTLGIIALASFLVAIFSSEPLFFFSLFLFLSSFEFFYNSSRFGGKPLVGAEFTVSLILSVTREADLTKSFIYSVPGRLLFEKLNLEQESILYFINSDRLKISSDSVNFKEYFEGDNFVTFYEYSKVVYSRDKSLESFLSAHSIGPEDFYGAASWIGHELEREVHEDRWWDFRARIQ